MNPATPTVQTWKKQADEEDMKVGLCREDALCQSKWIGLGFI